MEIDNAPQSTEEESNASGEEMFYCKKKNIKLNYILI